MRTCDELDLIRWGKEKLKGAGVECADYDAGLLLESSANSELFRRYIEKRAARYPLQYILKETEFMGIALRLEEGVFIPRHETEILVEKTLEIAKSIRSRAVNILEIGAGSGNIAISLTKNMANCKIIASDISDKAIKTAGYNAAANLVSKKIAFIKSDLFTPLDSKYLTEFTNIPHIYNNYFDIIISNPPYIKRTEVCELAHEISFEDPAALDGGWDGLDFYRRILSEGRGYLKPGGIFAFEIGYDQSAAVTEIAKQYPELGETEIFKDYNNFDRIAIIKSNG